MLLIVVAGTAYGIYRIATWDPNVVVSVDEGDNFFIKSGERFHLIGMRCLACNAGGVGIEAKEFTRECVLDKHIRIEKGKKPRKDEAGWIWAYVFYKDKKNGEELLLNVELVRRGLALAKPGRGVDLTHREELRAAETEAREARIGLWHPDNADRLKTLQQSR